MTETLQLRGRFAGIDLDELVDARVVRTWLYWGMFWLMVTPTVGVTISGLFTYPDYLGTTQLGLTFGRLRPIHVNGVIMGAFSALFIGECYYLVPRLCGVRVPWQQLGVPLAWVWNLALMAGLIGLGFGLNHGLEAGELPLYSEIPIFIVAALIGGFVAQAKGKNVFLWFVLCGVFPIALLFLAFMKSER